MKYYYRGLVATVTLMSSFAFADQAKVEVTSFRYVDSRSYVAELCGKIAGDAAAPAFVKVIVDETSKAPGIYNVVVGPEKNFCTIVLTYTGKASAALWGQASQEKTKAETNLINERE